MKSPTRPVYLDLLRIHLPLAGWVSILHRVSGVLLFLAFPTGVWTLSVSLAGEPGFQRMVGWLTHPLSKLFLLLLIWAFTHHLFAGLRHLALDAHVGVDLKRARWSSVAVLALSGATTLAFARWLFV